MYGNMAVYYKIFLPRTNTNQHEQRKMRVKYIYISYRQEQ